MRVPPEINARIRSVEESIDGTPTEYRNCEASAVSGTMKVCHATASVGQTAPLGSRRSKLWFRSPVVGRIMIVPDGADPGGRPAAATCPEIVGTINAATTAIHTRPDLKPRRDIVCFQRAAQVDREKKVIRLLCGSHVKGRVEKFLHRTPDVHIA
jgi:hypothetical protein